MHKDLLKVTLDRLPETVLSEEEKNTLLQGMGEEVTPEDFDKVINALKDKKVAIDAEMNEADANVANAKEALNKALDVFQETIDVAQKGLDAIEEAENQ